MAILAAVVVGGVVGVGGGACVADGGETPDPLPAVDLPFDLPAGFPAPRIPADNPITAAKVELGRHLFFDVRLSGNGTQSCGTCHEPARAYTDGKALPVGSTGDSSPRNSPMLANVAWLSTYTWANPILDTLEKQALVPMFADHPVELGMANHMPEIIDRLQADAAYPALFSAAFPDEDPVVTDKTIMFALTSFQRSLVSGNAPYDRYFNGGEADALTDEQKLGLQLFNSEVTECYHCHGGTLFTTAFVAANSATTERSFENNGLYNVDGNGGYPAPNVGLIEFTGEPGDMGRFRVPTLRNLKWSAPYFHDGSAATLDEVLDHYLAGGRTVVGANAGVGATSPHKSSLVRPFTLTQRERGALLAFIRDALSDDDFVTNPAYQSPFPAPITAP
jgi:cytochrome c peroxidase